MLARPIENWMLQRLADEREFIKKLTRRATVDVSFNKSDEFAQHVANTDETVAFALNWVADGRPEAYFDNLGYEWSSLFQGSPIQKLALRTQVLDVLLNEFVSESDAEFEFDVFVSHASEDKRDFVQPLINELLSLHVRVVRYDQLVLSAGDSLRQKIDLGLKKSRFGVVVLSPSFFAKSWAQPELNGLFAREVRGKSTIIPVWYNVTIDQVTEFSPILADRNRTQQHAVRSRSDCHVHREHRSEGKTRLTKCCSKNAGVRRKKGVEEVKGEEKGDRGVVVSSALKTTTPALFALPAG